MCSVVPRAFSRTLFIYFAFFVLILRRPRCPTLFPYTTLFRSAGASGIQEVRVIVKGGYTPDTIVVQAGKPVRLQFYRDRKSTRLNSSHLVISYAVFCLKKKTTR